MPVNMQYALCLLLSKIMGESCRKRLKSTLYGLCPEDRRQQVRPSSWKKALVTLVTIAGANITLFVVLATFAFTTSLAPSIALIVFMMVQSLRLWEDCENRGRLRAVRTGLLGELEWNSCVVQKHHDSLLSTKSWDSVSKSSFLMMLTREEIMSLLDAYREVEFYNYDVQHNNKTEDKRKRAQRFMCRAMTALTAGQCYRLDCRHVLEGWEGPPKQESASS